jgi:hypothetical protein
VLFGVLGTLVAGLLTNFQFNEIDFQVHDTYYVLESVIVIFLAIITLGLCRYFYKLTYILANRFRGFALFVSIVNPIIASFFMFLIYTNMRAISAFKEMNQNFDFTGRYIVLSIFFTIVVLQVVIEIELVKKLRSA